MYSLMIGLLALLGDPAQTKSEMPVEVMVVGTFHFDSGENLINPEVGDMLSAQRQAELANVAEALAAFNPTVVAVERQGTAPDYIATGYEAFTEDSLRTDLDETTQIGYRLAKTAGVDRVVAIDEQPEGDEPDYFPFASVMAQAQETGTAEQIQAMFGKIETRVGEEMARLTAMPMAEALAEVNDGFLSSVDYYFQLIEFDSGEAQAGAELTAYYYMRNTKIFGKLADVTRPGDRVVVIYGAGHKYWLDQIVDAAPGYVKVDPVPYLLSAE